MNKILLYSGGMDSWLMDKLWKPDIKLYINLNGRYNKQEIAHLPKDVIIENLDLSKWERKDRIVPLRNLYLCMMATNYADINGCEILIGATAGDKIYDKDLTFARMTSELLTYLYSKQWWNPVAKNIKVCLTYKDKTKEELLKMYVDQGGSLDKAWKESFSCYEPDENGNVCMSCKPCFRKFCSFAQLGYVDKNWLPIVIPYIGREIIPLIKSGTYGRGVKEEKTILNTYNQYKEYDKR